MRNIVFLMCWFLSSMGMGQELKKNPPAGLFEESHRFVFFAVLEGCYEDGLTQEEIDLIIPLREDVPGGRWMVQNLVFGCPLCSAAFDGFRLYSDRKQFISEMSETAFYNTFGQGLSEEVRAELQKKGRPCREAIEKLISKWINRRIELHRLTENEEAALRKELAAMREEGEKVLVAMQAGEKGEFFEKAYQGWKECPVCVGASPMKND